MIAHLETTNPDAATWARNVLGDSQSMSPAEVAREENVVAGPEDGAAIETGGAAYEAWVADIGYDPETTDMAGEELEEGWSIVFVEPSDAVIFQDEYRDLLSGRDVEVVSGAAYGVYEYANTA